MARVRKPDGQGDTLPVCTAQVAMQAFLTHGWSPAGVKGSHHFLRHEGDDRRRDVHFQVHATKSLKPKLLAEVLKKAGVDRGTFRSWL